MWLLLALASSVFAALTSILAKIGIDGVNSNLATALRTAVVLVMHGEWCFSPVPERHWGDQPEKLAVPDSLRSCHRPAHGCATIRRYN